MTIDVCNEFELLTTYQSRKKVQFATQLEHPSVLSDGYVANANNGYITVLQAIGVNPVFPNPITLLRPLNSFNFADKNCCLYKFKFRCYRAKLRTLANSNVSLTNSSQNVTGADMAGPITLTFPANSTTGTLTNQFPQYTFEEVDVQWQPNYFRPQLIIDGMDVLESSIPSYFSPNINLGDRSIGYDLPYKETLYKFYPKGIQSIEVHGFVAQAIAPAFTTYERFFLTCELDVLWK